ncbi:hypothetical protein E2C01_019900 [Portunus trituberculatus]|uniref:Uncharacterized protein n=1 Tax=Portunus trituberculatus TaxID=210409 RepID=A0A5B7E0N4_PORTR|nr:hypothetical protein [Portunus trituberculatus]
MKKGSKGRKGNCGKQYSEVKGTRKESVMAGSGRGVGGSGRGVGGREGWGRVGGATDSDKPRTHRRHPQHLHICLLIYVSVVHRPALLPWLSAPLPPLPSLSLHPFLPSLTASSSLPPNFPQASHVLKLSSLSPR